MSAAKDISGGLISVDEALAVADRVVDDLVSLGIDNFTAATTVLADDALGHIFHPLTLEGANCPPE